MTWSLRIVIAITWVMATILPDVAAADIEFKPSHEGDHYVYVPASQPVSILVIAHGSRAKGETAQDTALKYLKRWTNYANTQNLLVIAPVFDDARFGNLSGGYGGYRGLFGKIIAADQFVLNLVEQNKRIISNPSKPFLLYGHSAGAQFAIRFAVTHPNTVSRVVASAPGRFSYPRGDIAWPYGAGLFERKIKWDDGTKTKVSVVGSLQNFLDATGKVVVVIGSKDTKAQPQRPGHSGKNRIDYGKSWVNEMNALAKEHGLRSRASIKIIPGVGHDSKKLTSHSARMLFAP
jgi:poly(3-hydroxybutyrate) depolymerase